jgi:glycosyltransferase involved in cell wall biosynthesis
VLRALAPAHTVDVLVTRDADQAYVERHGGARLLRVPVSAEAPRREQIEIFRRAVRRQLDGADYDVVHFRDGWSGIPVLEHRDRSRYAAIFDAARAPATEPFVDSDLAGEMARDEEACLLASDLVLAPTEAARRFAAERGRHDRVLLSPPGVDVDRFDWDEPPTTGPPVILYCGALEQGRGVRVLLRAMVEVARTSDARLILAGPASRGFADSLRVAIGELGLAERVTLLGAIDQERVPTLIAQATVCVAPCAAELLPRVSALYPTKILEYLACRRPVIAPSRGTVTMLVRHNVEALLFAPGDPVDLARKLIRLLGDEGLRHRLADAGYELVRRDHTASAARRAVRRAYAELASRSPWRERFAEQLAAVPARAGGLYDLDDLEPSDSDGIDGLSGDSVIDDEATAFESVDLLAGEGDPADADVEADVDEAAAALLRRRRSDETGRDSGAWTAIDTPLPSRAPPSDDDWVVTHALVRSRAATWPERRERDDEDGTPLDVVPAPQITASITGGPAENRFLSGEIDGPPSPDAVDGEGAFTAAGALLGNEPSA